MGIEAHGRKIVSVGGAVIIFAAVQHASDASAGSTLDGLVWTNAGVQFGSLNTTGDFSPISTVTNLATESSYPTLTYDPTQNAFYVVVAPLVQNVAGNPAPLAPLSNGFDRIGAVAGAVTPLGIQNIPFPFIEGLGFNTSSGQLDGLVWTNAGVQFGSLNTTTGDFSPISTVTNLATESSYPTLTYDPAQNAFYVVVAPSVQNVAGNPAPLAPLSNGFDRIDAVTGAVTPLSIQNIPFPFIEGLGLASTVSTTVVPEPPTWLLLLAALVGLVCATWRRSTRRPHCVPQLIGLPSYRRIS
jgi:hypothetical protein